MLSQPRPCALVVRIRRGDEFPISARMVHTTKVHQLVNHHVVADLGWHQNKPPVQTDVAVVPTGTPPRPLIADGDSRDGKPVIAGQLQQTLPQLWRGAGAHYVAVQSAHARPFEPGALIRDPLEVAKTELRSVPPRAAARNRHSHAAVVVDAQDVSPRTAVSHEVELNRWRFVLEREPELHDDRIT